MSLASLGWNRLACCGVWLVEPPWRAVYHHHHSGGATATFSTKRAGRHTMLSMACWQATPARSFRCVLGFTNATNVVAAVDVLVVAWRIVQVVTWVSFVLCVGAAVCLEMTNLRVATRRARRADASPSATTRVRSDVQPGSAAVCAGEGHVRPPPLLSSCTQRTRHITSHHITSSV